MSDPDAKYVIVMTTCPTDEEATRIAAALVQGKMAACVQASAITSTYRWQGAVESNKEVRLTIKARRANYAAIEALIRVMHSYENPEVLAVPVLAGSRIYLEWIEAETQG